MSGGGTSGSVTVNLADASTSAKGAASFNSDNFSVSSGEVTIKDDGVTAAELGGGAIAVGFSVTDFDAGTQSSGTYTPDEANGPFQRIINGGAHTLAPPSNSTSLIIQYTNNSSAGTITTSGFTKVDGDTITTTNTHKFFFYITKSNSLSLLSVKALQ